VPTGPAAGLPGEGPRRRPPLRDQPHAHVHFLRRRTGCSAVLGLRTRRARRCSQHSTYARAIPRGIRGLGSRDALFHQGRAEEVLAAILGHGYPHVAKIHLGLGNIRTAQGDYEKAYLRPHVT
jgi:hypothetical protein